ncbi:hypothetical protein H0X06_01385 [Candidatus Dependentiae bacterium]|nr:hypothetical protein [Candidatus Dependentiae bacterium]
MNVYKKLALTAIMCMSGVVYSSELTVATDTNDSVKAVEESENASSESGIAGTMAAIALFAMVHDKLKYDRLLKQLCRYIEQGDLERLTYSLSNVRKKKGISREMKETLLSVAVKACDNADENITLRGSITDCAKLLGGFSLVGGTVAYAHSLWNKDATTLSLSQRVTYHLVGLYSLYKGVSYIEKGWNCAHAQKCCNRAHKIETFIKTMRIDEKQV